MISSLTTGNSIVAATILCIGILAYIPFHIKYARREKNELSSFFLGEGTVGSTRTGNDNLSLCFAFANAIWYFAYLGYSYGLSAAALQLPWTLGVAILATLLRRYILGTESGTIHGFLKDKYDKKTAILAATATLIGYIINCGFEIFYSVHLLCIPFGLQSSELVLSLILAAIVATYCSIGGYIANASTDIAKNLLGFLSVCLILILYWNQNQQSINSETLHQALIGATPPWHLTVGISVFAFFFNFVDMANWQSIAANRELPEHRLTRVKRALLISSALQMVAPALLGTLLGVLLRATTPGISDADKYFEIAFQSLAQGLPTGIIGIIFGIILLGLVSITISSTDSYILAAVQTLACDVFHRDLYYKARSSNIDQSERIAAEGALITWSRRYITIMTLGMVLLFAYLYYKSQGSGTVFDFQFIMYGSAICLFPALFLALRDNTKKHPPIGEGWAFASILFGLVAVLLPFFLVEFYIPPEISTSTTNYFGGLSKEAIINLTPLGGLFTSSVVCAIGIAFKQKL